MVELVGSVLMILGGGLVSAAGLASRSAVDRARALFGDSDGAVTRAVPPAWRELIDQLD